MFNVLVPVIATYAALRTWDGALDDTRFAAGLGLIAGFGITAYGVFVIIPVCVLLVHLIALIHKPAVQWRSAINLFLLMTLSVLPAVLWYLLVRAITGDFFSAELNEEAFVWMLRHWDQGAGVLAAEWLRKCAWMLRYAATQVLGLAVVALFLLWMLWRDPDAARAALRRAFAPVMAGLVVSATILIFYTCVGWIFPRTAYPIIPPLAVAAGVIALALAQSLGPSHRLLLARGISLLAAANVIYAVAKNGPFS